MCNNRQRNSHNPNSKINFVQIHTTNYWEKQNPWHDGIGLLRDFTKHGYGVIGGKIVFRDAIFITLLPALNIGDNNYENNNDCEVLNLSGNVDKHNQTWDHLELAIWNKVAYELRSILQI